MQGGFRNPLTYIPDGTISEIKIANGAITATKLADGSVSSVKLATNLQSDNYVAGTSGWLIERDTGDAEFSDVTVRGEIDATSGSISGALTIELGGLFRTSQFWVAGQWMKIDGQDTYLTFFRNTTVEVGEIGLIDHPLVAVNPDVIGVLAKGSSGGIGGEAWVYSANDDVWIWADQQVMMFAGSNVLVQAPTTIDNTLTVSPTHADGAVALNLDIERAWEFRQSGTGASTNLRLATTSNKFLEIWSDSIGRGVRIDPNNARIADMSDLNTYIGFSPAADQIEMYCGGNQEFLLGTAGILIPNAYNATTASAANVHVDSAGQLRRSTSSKRYKKEIQSWSGSVERLRPVSFRSKEHNTRHIGLIAEEVDKVFPEATLYDGDGKPEAIDWNAITTALIHEVNILRKRVVALESAGG